MSARVKIKAGPIEFEYEGETELSMEGIKDLFTHIETLFKVPSLREVTEQKSMPDTPGHDSPVREQKSGSSPLPLHISSVAAKLNVKTGPELIVAAAATLQIYQGAETFSRGELLDLMKKATKYFKVNMRSNMSAAMNTLVGPTFNQIGEDKYSLTQAEYERLEARLA